MRHRNPLRRTIVQLVMAAGFAAATNVCCAHGFGPRDTPVDRLITNLEKLISEHPDDPMAYYRLGRVHALALERNEETVPTDWWTDPGPAEGSRAKKERWREEKIIKSSASQRKDHLVKAIENLNKAIRLDPTNPKFHLTLACAIETGEPLKAEVLLWPALGSVVASLPANDHEKERAARYEEKVKELGANPKSVGELLDDLREQHTRSYERDAIFSTAMRLKDDPAHKEAIEMFRQAYWHQQIEDQFFTAMLYALPQDGFTERKPPAFGGELTDFVAYESAKEFLRVVNAREARPSDAIRIKVAERTVKAFDELPESGITPIVFGLDRRPLSSLLSDSTVNFRLDGINRIQRWNWIRPDAGLLVWDPDHTGRITSGRQLFGSVTWWLFFDNGYQALDAIDDNRDGRLSDAELKGLAVWFDRDSNGVSDPGEVIPVEDLGIAAISTRAESEEDGCPANYAGLTMRDGRVLPTYDWIAHPVAVSNGLQHRNAAWVGLASAFASVMFAVPMARRRRA